MLNDTVDKKKKAFVRISNELFDLGFTNMVVICDSVKNGSKTYINVRHSNPVIEEDFLIDIVKLVKLIGVTAHDIKSSVTRIEHLYKLIQISQSMEDMSDDLDDLKMKKNKY